MKILNIQLNCKRIRRDVRVAPGSFFLCFFRTPVILECGESGKTLCPKSIAIFSEGKLSLCSPNGRQIKFDMIYFTPSPEECDYIKSSGIVLNTPVTVKDDFVISSIIKNLRVKFIEQCDSFSEFSALSMKMLFLCVSEELEKAKNRDNSDIIPRYSQLCSLRESIYESPQKNWDINVICNNMRMSRAYFHRIYTRAFGTTCHQDIINSRILRSEELLINTDLSVAEIAEKCGYDSDSYFMRQFRIKKGCTPTEFRRNTAENYMNIV